MIEEEELIKIWQSSFNEERVKFEKSRLILDMKSSLDRIHKYIKYRDFIEIIDAIIMIPVLVYMAYIIPFIVSKIGLVWIVLWLIYWIFRIQSSKKYKPSAFTESYFDYLKKTREYLKVQKELLNSKIYRYILPILTGAILFIMGVSGELPIHILIIFFIGAIGVGVFGYFLIKRRVKKGIIPRLDEIDKLMKVMKE